MNKKTIALTTDQYESIIKLIQEGFIDKEGKQFRPNNRIATILILEANLGLRIGDILSLKLNNIIKDGNRWRLDIKEEKTGKNRNFTVSNEIYNYIKMYCLENNINFNCKIFDIQKCIIQRQLKIVSDYLELKNISTHSFRKYYATELYNNNSHNIALVSKLLQHSSSAITQRYIGISTQEVEEAIAGHNHLL